MRNEEHEVRDRIINTRLRQNPGEAPQPQVMTLMFLKGRYPTNIVMNECYVHSQER